MTLQPVYNRTLPDRTIPYITRDQYRASPTAMDTQNLIRNGAQADQDSELDRIILQASGWCDNMAEQPLTAQTTTETMRAPVASDGTLRLHPRQHPIMAVTGASFGPDPANLSALSSLAAVWVENQSVILPMQTTLASGWTGPLQFGTARPGSRVYVALSYVAGYAVSTLTSAVLAAATVLPVKDATGFVPGQQVRIQQGGAPTGTGSAQTALAQTTGVVSSADLIAKTVTLTAPVGLGFEVGAAVTTLPEEVEQAAVYATTALLKQRGSGALVMRGGNSATVKKDGSQPGAEEFETAEAILAFYRPAVP